MDVTQRRGHDRHGQEMNGAKLDFHEYLRIEQRKDGLVYVAQPMGRKETHFRLTKENKNTLVFEKSEHDFPNVIEYQKRDDGSLCVRVSGLGKRKTKRFSTLCTSFRNLIRAALIAHFHFAFVVLVAACACMEKVLVPLEQPGSAAAFARA